MHERGLLEDEGEVLGVQLDPRKMEARPTERRRWRLDRAPRCCLRRRTLSGRQLGRVLFHATFYPLLGRNTLGVFKAAYAFVAKYGDQLVVGQRGDPPLPRGDAVGVRLVVGVCRRRCLSRESAVTVRVTELERFRRCQAGARSAHADARAASAEDKNDFPVEDLDRGWEIDGAFPEVDMHLMQLAA